MGWTDWDGSETQWEWKGFKNPCGYKFPWNRGYLGREVAEDCRRSDYEVNRAANVATEVVVISTGVAVIPGFLAYVAHHGQ
jgi:hypothetical protein